MRSILAGLAALLIATLSNAALLCAEPIPVVVNVTTDSQETFSFSPDGDVLNDGSFLSLQGSMDNPAWRLTWRIIGGESNGFGADMRFVNTTDRTADYSIRLTLPMTSILPAISAGYFFLGGIHDENGDGATWATLPETPLEAALIDGETYWSYFPDPTVVEVAPGEPSGFIAPIEGQRQPGPAVLNSLGLGFDFSLTAGDRVSLNSTFNVIAADAQPVGDMNADWEVNNLDIAAMALALTDPIAYINLYPTTPLVPIGDLNQDEEFNNLDIAPFTMLLVGSGARVNSVPEPSRSVLVLAGLLTFLTYSALNAPQKCPAWKRW